MKVFPCHRLRVSFIVAIIALLGSGLIPWSFARANEPLRTPENQVFQFVQRDTFTYADGQTVKPAAYLWIPETCRRLRGLLILGQNVTEHTLVGHPAIRAAAPPTTSASSIPSGSIRRSSPCPRARSTTRHSST